MGLAELLIYIVFIYNRMQQNDVENIIPFFMLGFLHVMTWYSPYNRSLWHFRIFFVSRIAYSFCHYFAIQVIDWLLQ